MNKISGLRKKIIINLSTTAILLGIFALIFIFNIKQKEENDNDIRKIKSEAASLRNQSANINSKTSEIKKYKAIVQKMNSSKKSTANVKMDDINSNINSLAKDYHISDIGLKVSVPIQLKQGIFNRTTIEVLFSTITLSFTSLDDVNALLFIHDVINAFPGHVVVENFDLDKSKEYKYEDFIEITSKKSGGSIKAKISFIWYSYKNKDNDIKSKELLNK